MTRSVAKGTSFSGYERNTLYFGGLPDGQFEDLSGITGLDDRADSRAFALLDFDRDGWLDIALGNLTAPRMRLLRNGIGDRLGDRVGYVAFRFVGGNHTATPSREWSARDAFGTSVELDLGGQTLYREHQPEGGFLSQHSSTMIVGIGEHDRVASLTVRWLSGKTLETKDVAAGTLVTVYENPVHSPTGETFVTEPYSKAPTQFMTRVRSEGFWKGRLLPAKERSGDLVVRHNGEAKRSQQGLTLVTTMATWCVACVTEMPEMNAMREAFSEDELAMYAVPVDAEETVELIEGWAEKHDPPYELLTGIDSSEVDKVNQVILEKLRADAVPATFLTDNGGRVLIARWGVPSISEVRKWLWLMESDSRPTTDGP